MKRSPTPKEVIEQSIFSGVIDYRPWSVRLSGLVSKNRLRGHGRNRVYRSPEYVQFRENVTAQLIDKPRPPLAWWRIDVECKIYLPEGSQADGQNYLECIFDVLEHYAWMNDRQIARCYHEVIYVSDVGIHDAPYADVTWRASQDQPKFCQK